MKFKSFFFLLGIVLLASCGDKDVNTIVLLPETTTATKIPPSLTPTLLSTETPIPTFETEATISVATLNAAATTESIRVNLINQFPELQDYYTFCSPGYCYGVQSSPNGQWIYLTNFNTLDLFSVDGEKVGRYSFYDIYGYTIDYNGGYIDAVYWSNDGRYLYVSANPGGDGGPESYFGYKSALVRVNLENGSWDDMGISGSFEISPNDKYIIFSDNKVQVQVRSLSTGQEQVYSTPNEYLYFGKYVWSSDGRKVVFVGAPEDWYADDSRFAIFMVNVENQTILQLDESSLPFYFPVSWAETDKVILNKFNEWGEWTLDLSTSPPKISP